MNIDDAVKILRRNNVDVIQTLEEYFLLENNKLVLVSEERIKKNAKTIQDASNNISSASKKIAKRRKASI